MKKEIIKTHFWLIFGLIIALFATGLFTWRIYEWFKQAREIMNEVNFIPKPKQIEQEPTQNSIKAAVFLEPVNNYNDYLEPQASLSKEEKSENNTDELSASGNAEFSNWPARVDYWADFYLLKEQDKEIIKSIIMCESGGDHNSIGDFGKSLGIAQFKKSTFFEQMNYYGLSLDWYNQDDQLRLISVMAGDNKYFHWKNCYNKITNIRIVP